MKGQRRNLPLTNLLDIEQVVTKLHGAGLKDLNDKWVKNQADRGNLPFTIVARKRRFREDLIDQMIMDWCNEAA